MIGRKTLLPRVPGGIYISRGAAEQVLALFLHTGLPR